MCSLYSVHKPLILKKTCCKGEQILSTYLHSCSSSCSVMMRPTRLNWASKLSIDKLLNCEFVYTAYPSQKAISGALAFSNIMNGLKYTLDLSQKYFGFSSYFHCCTRPILQTQPNVYLPPPIHRIPPTSLHPPLQYN